MSNPSKNIVISEHSLGSYYRMNNGMLEWQPMVNNQHTPIEDDWGEVEKELVGSEPCVFRGEAMTLNEAYEIIENELSTY